MAFPRFDIAERGEGKFVLARIKHEEDGTEPDGATASLEIVGVFASETEARRQLLKILSTPTATASSGESQTFAH